MASLNRIVLIGRLTKNPEMRYIPSGEPVTTFTLAVDRRPLPSGEKQADFIRIVTWRKVAESCANNLTKGRLVAVEGRLQIRSFDTQDGTRRTVAEVVANNVQFLDRGREGQESPLEEKALTGLDEEEINLDDTPFADLDMEENR